MKSIVKFFVAMSFATFSLCALFPSCVNSEYELSEENINTDITIAQDGIVFPLGKTVPVTLGELFEQYGQDFKDYIQNQDGKYGFCYAGSFDFSNDIADIKEQLKIDAVEVTKQFAFDFSNANLDGFDISGINVSPDPIDLSSKLKMPSITLPEIDESLQIKTRVVKPNTSDLNLDFSSLDKSHIVEFSALKSPVSIPDLSSTPIWDKPMTYEELSFTAAMYQVSMPPMIISTGFDEVSMDVPVKLALPKGIASVGQIELNPDANVEVSIKALNPMFIEGQIITTVNMDFKNLFHVDRVSDGTLDGTSQRVKDDFVVTNTSSPEWETRHVYHVDALAIESSDWKKTANGLELDKVLNFKVNGIIENEGLKTSLKCLHDNGNNPMQMVLSIKFNNFSINNVQMDIDPITITKTVNVSVNSPGIKLPEIVSEVNYVDLENTLNLAMQATLPEAVKSLNVELESLEMAFPDGYVIEDEKYSDGKLSYKNVSLVEGFNDAVTINRLYLPKPVGTLSYHDKVLVTAKVVASGTVNSKDLLDDKKSGDVDVLVDMDYAPMLKDYRVTTKDYSFGVNVAPVQISEKLPEEIANTESVAVFLEGEPSIKIVLDYPTAGDLIRVFPDKTTGLKLLFPEMLRFKTLPSEYNYNPADNSISFTGNQIIPNLIELPIEKIVIKPQLVEGDGYYLKGEMRIEGGARLETTSLNKNAVEALVAENAEIAFSANMPELIPAKLSMGEYAASIKETLAFDMMEIDGLPDMIKSIDAIELKDVYLNLEVDAASFIEHIGKVDLDMDFDVTLPKLIMIEGAQSGNVLSVSGKLNKDNKIIVDPIKIIGLDLSEVEFKDEKIFFAEQKIEIAGNVRMKNISVDLDDFKNEDFHLTLNGSIASKDSNRIELAKVEATVDYQLDPISHTISLAGLMGDLGNNIDFSLDLNRYHLALDLKTNLALPLQANVDILPFYGREADESKKKTLPLSVNWSLPASDTTHTKLWISNSENDKPLDNDYTHRVLDLLSIVNDMPDSIRLDINARTEPNAKFVIEPSEKYVLKADYELGLPLEFGENFHVSFTQAVEQLPALVNELLAEGVVAGLAGKVTNSLPLQFDLELQLLDNDGNVIPLADGAGRQTVKPCALDGKPQETELEFVISVDKTVEKAKVEAVELKFTVSSLGAGGIQFHEDCFIQAELALLLPEGISMDIKDILNAENNNN